ncbi:hypothetical protein [Paenibacillus oceani]|uniref:Neutral/alkaline non-lysosomal ceramidase N-terminal domain-containing protein n=1 Tax=Paenibacillus oceani TaxID=2772510 RepID=A0A927CD61_9BACL|nr:hypothetical protein [Paenibacillus oceani]MBD2864066.1 hypothetical protein [Paenibacillus oceani]
MLPPRKASERSSSYTVRIKMLCIILLAVLVVPGCYTSEKTYKETGQVWSMGYGEQELVPNDLPKEKYYIAGYNTGTTIEGVLDSPYVKALWLDDNTGRGGIAIAVIDCIGLSGTDIRKIRNRLSTFSKEAGARDIHIISTHTHAGIDTLGLWGPTGHSGRSASYMQLLEDRTVLAVETAYSNRQNGRMLYGSAETGPLQRDSRPPYVYDRSLYSLRFVSEDGGGGIRIINYAAHPEALRSKNKSLSADFPAYLAAKIQEETGDSTVFIPGALGGLIMTERLKDKQGVEYPVEENVVRTGHILAETALAVDHGRELAPKLVSLTDSFALPLENIVFAGAVAADIISHRTVSGSGALGLALPTQVSYLSIGDLPILLVPGEIFPELVTGGFAGAGLAANPAAANPRTLREIAGKDELLLFGLANDMIGYIVPPNDFLVHPSRPYLEEGVDSFGRGHYEETNSMGPDTAMAVAASAERLFERVRNGER